MGSYAAYLSTDVLEIINYSFIKSKVQVSKNRPIIINISPESLITIEKGFILLFT